MEQFVYEEDKKAYVDQYTIFWGKYGRLALSFLEEQNPRYYTELVLSNKIAAWVHQTNEWLTSWRLALLVQELDAHPLDEEATIREIATNHIRTSKKIERQVTAALIEKIHQL